MGGLGSGRRSGNGKPAADDCRSLDINKLSAKGVLTDGWRGGWSWTLQGKTVASISVTYSTDVITLSYRSKIAGEDWQQVREPVEVHWRSCRYGGQRPFFICPGISNGQACNRIVSKLYCGGRYYLCRHCYRLGYTSQRECRSDRAIRRAFKIRNRIGCVGGIDDDIAAKPKGMWQRTYRRLIDEHSELQIVAIARLHEMMSRFDG